MMAGGARTPGALPALVCGRCGSRSRRTCDPEVVENIKLASIFIHPIKSCQAVELGAATISAIGLAGDRLWQVVDGDQRGMTQRQHPILATVQPTITDHGGVQIRAPGQELLDVAPPTYPVTTRSHFGLPVPALDAGEEAAEWFSSLVGAPVRLVRMANSDGWRLPDDLDVFGQAAPFTDAAPILVTATASLAHLQAHASEPFGMDRFRPNLVLTGSEPWAEDTWTDLRVGDAMFRVVTPWPRCTIPRSTSRPAIGTMSLLGCCGPCGGAHRHRPSRPCGSRSSRATPCSVSRVRSDRSVPTLRWVSPSLSVTGAHLSSPRRARPTSTGSSHATAG